MSATNTFHCMERNKTFGKFQHPQFRKANLIRGLRKYDLQSLARRTLTQVGLSLELTRQTSRGVLPNAAL